MEHGGMWGGGGGGSGYNFPLFFFLLYPVDMPGNTCMHLCRVASILTHSHICVAMHFHI